MRYAMKNLFKVLCVFTIIVTLTLFLNPLDIKAAPANPVSSVSIERLEFSGGHAVFTVRVVGYGSTYATIDGKSVQVRTTRLIGNPVTTFIYTVDCGVVGTGTHRFIFRATSLNRPWNTVTQNWIFDR